MTKTEPAAAQPAALTEQALFARLQRRLRARGELLRTSRYGSRSFNELGRHYIVCPELNAILHTHVELADWLAELEAEAAQEVAQ
jgi:hypothetical protein